MVEQNTTKGGNDDNSQFHYSRDKKGRTDGLQPQDGSGSSTKSERSRQELRANGLEEYISRLEKLDELAEEQRQIIFQRFEAELTSFSGPLPHPDLLKGYKDIDPNLPNDVAVSILPIVFLLCGLALVGMGQNIAGYISAGIGLLSGGMSIIQATRTPNTNSKKDS